jgi:hypothetical protein
MVPPSAARRRGARPQLATVRQQPPLLSEGGILSQLRTQAVRDLLNAVHRCICNHDLKPLRAQHDRPAPQRARDIADHHEPCLSRQPLQHTERIIAIRSVRATLRPPGFRKRRVG